MQTTTQHKRGDAPAPPVWNAETFRRTDPGFRGFLMDWRRHRRCPLAVVDYLIEHDLPVQAEVARWVATFRDRPVNNPVVRRCERGGTCGPYPTINNNSDGRGCWFWCENNSVTSTKATFNAHWVPTLIQGPGLTVRFVFTRLDSRLEVLARNGAVTRALVALLDAYEAEE
jgi:hypothetical protein